MNLRRASWLFMLVATVALLVVGAVRESGPLTQQDRIDAIAQRLACPTCSGESIYVSRASAAEALRAEIARQVAAGQRTDDEIIAYVEARFGGQVLLVPRATGLDALVWALPVAVLVASLAALTAAFVRWRRRDEMVPSDDDRAIVAQALANNDD
jgi:cytochrome c-type biogenesis protein CcmH/NrfF